MVTKTIVHFEIPANEVEKLSDFYRTVFGWKFEKAKMPGFDYWLISTGPRGKSVGGGMYKREGPNDGAGNFKEVEGMDRAKETSKRQAGTEWWGRRKEPGKGG